MLKIKGWKIKLPLIGPGLYSEAFAVRFSEGSSGNRGFWILQYGCHQCSGEQWQQNQYVTFHEILVG